MLAWVHGVYPAPFGFVSMMSVTKGEAKDGQGLALESYLAAIRLTQDPTTLGELEVQVQSDDRLCCSDREFLRSLVGARAKARM